MKKKLAKSLTVLGLMLILLITTQHIAMSQDTLTNLSNREQHINDTCLTKSQIRAVHELALRHETIKDQLGEVAEERDSLFKRNLENLNEVYQKNLIIREKEEEIIKEQEKGNKKFFGGFFAGGGAVLILILLL